MTIIFVVNKVIGRDYIGAIDAGAYFGLTVARALYNPAHLQELFIIPLTQKFLVDILAKF